MKRDMELIRQILQSAEALEFVKGETHELYWSKSKHEAYQIALMKDAGLVEAAVNTTSHIPTLASISRLTWAGHDFLDASRDDTIWKKAMINIIKPGASYTFSLLVEWLKQEAHDRIFRGPATG